MAELTDVPVDPLSPERFEDVISTEAFAQFKEAIARAQDILSGRVVWNVNSTARGGGVAEMLQSLLAYARGADVDARWVVIEGSPAFFRVTKRLHNNLHGAQGDGGELGEEEKATYDATIFANAEALGNRVKPGDVVIVHDPQPAGLVDAFKDSEAHVIWRCHVGIDAPNEIAKRAWEFLIPYVDGADAYVFSRRAFAWEGLDHDRVTIIPPSIDAFSPKNQDLEPEAVEAILGHTRLIGDNKGDATFVRRSGEVDRVTSESSYYEGGELPPANARIVSQVSRWDRLKDPAGVIAGFAKHVVPATDAHLIVAGPAVEAVTDDPEGAEVLEECRALWEGLPSAIRQRIHLACLSMEDGQENAAIVNALQRRSEVIVQKSVAEGFGLTVAEAMWKARPVIATRIGGIQDQVIHGVTGLLIDDPADLEGFGEALNDLLDDEYKAAHMGEEAQMRVRDEFLGPRHLMQYVDLIATLVGASGS